MELPNILFDENKEYFNLSNESKILYALMLDRQKRYPKGFSFPVKEISVLLNRGNKKVSDFLKELKEADLCTCISKPYMGSNIYIVKEL